MPHVLAISQVTACSGPNRSGAEFDPGRFSLRRMVFNEKIISSLISFAYLNDALHKQDVTGSVY